MRITWDPAKAVENLRWHRVRFEEAGEVLRDPFALTREDPRHDELRLVTRGASTSRPSGRRQSPVVRHPMTPTDLHSLLRIRFDTVTIRLRQWARRPA